MSSADSGAAETSPVKNTLALSASVYLTYFTTKHDELDVDPWMLNCSNGTLNLRTAKLLPHLRTEIITNISN